MTSLLTFVALGLPDGMLGVAWPTLRQGFGQPLAALGELLLAVMTGYLLATSLTGPVLRRFGTPKVLIGSSALAALATALFVTARWWPVMAGASLLLGAAGGGLDAGVNTVVALSGRARLMNLIHAAFGTGAALGPLAVTTALAARSSWRGAYVLLWVLQVCVLAMWVLARSALPVFARHARSLSTVAPGTQHGIPPRTRPGSGPPDPAAPVNRRLFLGLSLATFFCYGGAEISVGSWSASYLTGHEHFSATDAGITVFAFWAGLAAGRLIPAALGHRLPASAAARAGTAGAIIAAAEIWAGPGPAVRVVALTIIGVSLGPIFPALMNLTPNRLGQSAAVSAVGWQLAAAGAGGSGLSAVAGAVLQRTGLASFGAVLVVLTVGLGLLNAALGHRARLARPESSPA